MSAITQSFVQKKSGTSLIYRFVAAWLLLVCSAFSATANETEPFISGYDVVSYFRDSGPLEGRPDFSTRHNSHNLWFASQENLNDFLVEPDKYMPAYNGYCAYGMVFGMISEVDPLQYDIIDGALYLQLDSGTKRRFNRRLKRNLKKSKRAWNKLSASAE